jgi:hypothetical protein
VKSPSSRNEALVQIRWDARIPANGNVAPPGFYTLFIMDNSDVPSIGHFIRLS